MSAYLQGIIYQAQAQMMEAEAKIAMQRMQLEAQRLKENLMAVMDYSDVTQTIYNSDNYSEDDPRYVSPMHMNEEGRKRAAEVARKKREEKEAEEARNMKMWGRKDDPRLDPTSEFYDPLKLVHKDVGNVG